MVHITIFCKGNNDSKFLVDDHSVCVESFMWHGKSSLEETCVYESLQVCPEAKGLQ